MTDLFIEEEFERLLRPLTEEEFNGLEQDILKHGILDPIITWESIIVDGHHRHKIAQKHNLKFNTESINFNDTSEARHWIIEKQAFRRNLNKEELILLIGREYNSIKNNHGGDRKSEHYTEGITESTEKDDGQNTSNDGGNIKSPVDLLISTVGQVAEKHDVGESSVKRYAKIAEVVDELPEEEQKAYVNGTKEEKEAVREKINGRLWTSKMTEQDRKNERDIQMSKFESDLMSNNIHDRDKRLIGKLKKGEVVNIRIEKYHHTLMYAFINGLFKLIKLT